jgi:lysyl-tRNA synthetase class I
MKPRFDGGVKMKILARQKKSKQVMAFMGVALLLFSLGCTIRMVSEYDPTLDRGVTELNQRTEKFITGLEKTYIKMKTAKNEAQRQELQKKLSYAANEEFYDDFRADLQVLTIRAEITPNNQLTVNQLKALGKVLDDMEKQQKEGFQDVGEFELDRQAFNRTFRAILKLEIAKKRGQKS